MMAKLREDREEHADHRGESVPHLWLGLLPLCGSTVVRVAVKPTVMVVILRALIFLHRVHSNVSV